MDSAEPGNASSRYPYALGLSIFLVQVALGIVLFATFQEWVPDELGGGDGWGGYLLAAYGAARFVFEAPTGAISDRIERRLGLLVGFVLMLPAIALMAVVQNRWAFLVFAGQLGFATAFLWPATYAMSADLYPVDRRGKVVGFLNLAQLLGFGVGAGAGVFLVTAASWAQFVVAGGAVAAAFVAALTGLPNYQHGSLFRLLPVQHRPRLREVLSRQLTFLSGIVLLSSVGLAMVVPAIRPYGENQLDASFATLTAALIPAVAVGVALYLPAGHLTDRWGRTRPMILGQSLVVVGLLVCAGTSTLAVAAGGATLIFAGNVLTVPALNAAVMDLAPETHRGTLIGLMVALSGLGLAIGPAIGGVLVGSASAPVAFGVAGALCAVAVLAVVTYGAVFARPHTTANV